MGKTTARNLKKYIFRMVFKFLLSYFYSLIFNYLGGIHIAQGGLSDVVTQQEIIRRTVLFSQMIIFV